VSRPRYNPRVTSATTSGFRTKLKSSFAHCRPVLRIGIETKDAPDCFDRYKASESLWPARSKDDSDEDPHKTAAVREFREYRRAAHVVEVPDRTGLDELKFIACSRFCEPEKVRITSERLSHDALLLKIDS
jgi:hypothetical protein